MSRQSNSTRHSVGTASSARAKGKQRVQDSDSDDDSLQQHLSLVAPEFLHRPLSVEDSQVKLRTLVAELKACITQLTDGLEILQSMAIEVATATKKIVLSGDGDDEEMETEHEIEEDNPQMKLLDKAFRETLDKIAEMQFRSSVLSEIRQKLVQGHEITDVSDRYAQTVAPLLEAYIKKTPRQRYGKDETYIAFRTEIWETVTDGAAVPNINKFLPTEEGEEADSDDEIEIGAQTVDFKCGLTLMFLVEPVISTKCIHIFSQKSIFEYIDSYKHTGCDKFFSKADFSVSEVMKRRVAAHITRLKEEKEANSGAGGTQRGKTGTQYHEIVDSDDDD